MSKFLDLNDVTEAPRAPLSWTTSAPKARLLEIDVPAPAPAAFTPAPHSAEGKRGAADVGPEFEARRARTLGDDAFTASAGFEGRGGLRYAAGHGVNAAGVENAAKAKRDFDSLPLAEGPDGLPRLAGQIRAEERIDLVVPTASLFLAAGALEFTGPDGAPGVYPIEGLDGSATAEGSIKAAADSFGFGGGVKGPRAGASVPAFASVCAATGVGGAGWLSRWSQELRESAFNAALGELLAPAPVAEDGDADDEATEAEKPTAPAEIKIRTRKLAARRSIYAGVSPGYAVSDPDAVIAGILAVLPKGARCNITYDAPGSRWMLDVLFASNVSPTDFATGEYFRLGARIIGNDTGAGSLTAEILALRNLCENLAILATAKMGMKRIIHRGSGLANVTSLVSHVASNLDALAPLLSRWGFAKREILAPDLGTVAVLATKVRKGQAKVEALDWGGLSRDQRLAAVYGGLAQTEQAPITVKMVPDLIRAHNADVLAADEAITRASVAASFSRNARECNSDPWTADALERSSGGLTFETAAVPVQYAWVRYAPAMAA